MDLRRDTVRDLADRVRSRQLAARELVAHSLERIEALDPRVNAFVAIDAERAMADAAALDERIAHGGAHEDELAHALPLAGIPLGVKDLEDAAGLPTVKGSALLAGGPPASTDSVLVARLRAAGCIVVGKTNTPEHGFTGDTFNVPFGATFNPWDLERSPGGSSGGSAAALAAGMVPLATGSDGGGSIRIPSALCGLSGLKPSQGRVPNGGATPPGSGLFSCKAPMARRIADVALALGAAVGPHPTDPFSLPVDTEPWPDLSTDDATVPRRVAWAPDMGWEVDAEVRRVTGAAVARLADAGCEVVEIDRVFRDDPTLPWFHLWTAHLLRSFGHLHGTDDWERLTPALRDQVLFAKHTLGPDDIARALDAIHLANLDLVDVFEQAPLLLSPVTAGRTPRSEHQGEVDGTETPMWVRFTYPLNLTRNPAGTVCAGFDEDGLPVGLQVVGPHHQDGAVLRALAGLEQVLEVDAIAPDVDPV